jgi:hypothetical protein
MSVVLGGVGGAIGGAFRWLVVWLLVRLVVPSWRDCTACTTCSGPHKVAHRPHQSTPVTWQQSRTQTTPEHTCHMAEARVVTRG